MKPFLVYFNVFFYGIKLFMSVPKISLAWPVPGFLHYEYNLGWSVIKEVYSEHIYTFDTDIHGIIKMLRISPLDDCCYTIPVSLPDRLARSLMILQGGFKHCEEMYLNYWFRGPLITTQKNISCPSWWLEYQSFFNIRNICLAILQGRQDLLLLKMIEYCYDIFCMVTYSSNWETFQVFC